MAKKALKRRTTINGIYLDEITEEQKAELLAKNPKLEKYFEKK